MSGRRHGRGGDRHLWEVLKGLFVLAVSFGGTYLLLQIYLHQGGLY